MKKCILILSVLLAFAFASYGQATMKQYVEIYNLSKPLGIKIPAGTTVYRADSGYWMVMDSAFAKTDSGATINRLGGTYFHFLQNYPLVKYTTGADTASTTLRKGSVRSSATHLWIKVNGTWKKLKYD